MSIDNAKVFGILNRIMEMELAGAVRYTHYSLMVYGYNRIPIVSWLREQATESLAHATAAGEMITSLGIGPLLETHKHDIGDILRESLEHERTGIQLYRDLLTAVEGQSVWMEEYARAMIQQEEMHAHEVNKMLRKPGELS